MKIEPEFDMQQCICPLSAHVIFTGSKSVYITLQYIYKIQCCTSNFILILVCQGHARACLAFTATDSFYSLFYEVVLDLNEREGR